MGEGRARSVAVAVLACAFMASPGGAPAASEIERASAAGRHDAGKRACATGAPGRACRKRRRAARRAPRPAVGVDVAVPAPVEAAPEPVEDAGCGSADVPAEAAALRAAAAATLCLVNAARREAGVPRLRQNPRLTAAARAHAGDMVARGFFSHDTPEGVSGFERASAAGYAASQYSEVIAAGTPPAHTPRGVVGAWLESESHRVVLLSPLYRDGGPAVAAGTPRGGAGGTFVLELGDR